LLSCSQEVIVTQVLPDVSRTGLDLILCFSQLKIALQLTPTIQTIVRFQTE